MQSHSTQPVETIAHYLGPQIYVTGKRWASPQFHTTTPARYLLIVIQFANAIIPNPLDTDGHGQ